MLAILRTVKAGEEKPTCIMYAVNMAYIPTKRLLQSLVKQGLLRERLKNVNSRSKKRYEITEKGSNALEYFEKANELIEIETSRSR